MSLSFKAAILHACKTPLIVEHVNADGPSTHDVLVKVRAASLCHTDLEVIDGSLTYPLPMILGHEAAGIVEAVGSSVTNVSVGDHVVLSWNPHCGHCFQCDRGQPILCDTYIGKGKQGVHFDGQSKANLAGEPLHHLMFIGAFAEYCILPSQQAIVVSKDIPFDRACLIGCGVMTGVGAAMNVAKIHPGDTVMVFGCGAVGLAAVQGAVMSRAGRIIAVDVTDEKLVNAQRVGANHLVNATMLDPVEVGKQLTAGRGVDVVIESAGHLDAFRQTTEVVRLGGQVIWLGKIDVTKDASFRWGSLMGEKRIRRSSYGGARPRRDFPFLARAYLDGALNLDALITNRISLDDINEGFEMLRAGKSIRTVVTF